MIALPLARSNAGAHALISRVVVLAALSSLSLVHPTGAAPGDLDCAFGTGGHLVETTVARGVFDFVVDPTDDSMIWLRATSGTAYIGKTDANGDLDTTFGTTDPDGIDGMVTHTVGGNGILSHLERYTSGPHAGKLLAIGTADTSTTGDTDVMVVRFTAAGALDSTFGTGGVFTFDWDEPAAAMRGVSVVRLSSTVDDLVIQPDGRAVLVGGATAVGTSGPVVVGVARLTDGGSLDPTFDSDGKRLLDGTSGPTDSVRRQTLGLAPDGKIFIGGVQAGTNERTVVFRLLSSGASDAGFDSDGWVSYHFSQLAGASSPNPDFVRNVLPLGGADLGSVVVVVQGFSDLGTSAVIARLNADGSRNTAFDGDSASDMNGVVRYRLGPGQQSVSESRLVGPDSSRFVVTGRDVPADLAVVMRVNSNDGSLDTSWGTAGTTKPSIGTPVNLLFAVRETSTGQIVLSGQNSPNGLFIKYLAGGELRQTITTILSALPDPSAVGEGVLVSVEARTTAPSRGVTPPFTGTFEVSRGADSCTATVVDGGNASGTGSCLLTLNSLGATPITATYQPDTPAYCSSSDTEAHEVISVTTTTSIAADTPDPSVVGQPVSVSVQVAAPTRGPGLVPTGSVTVTAGAVSCMAALSGGTGSCSLTPSFLGAGNITADYPGQGVFQASSDGEAHTVNQASTTTTISSDSPDPSVVGQAITIGVWVAALAPGAGTPSGSVDVSAAGGASCSATLTGGSGSCSLVPSAVGGTTLTATYGGDASFLGSTDTEGHQVDPGSTTTLVTADTPDPSVVNTAVQVNWNTSPTAPAAGTPTGTVTVTASGGPETCSAPVGAGTCALVLTGLGSRTLAVDYSGDASFTASGASEAHEVVQGPSTTTITGDSPDPSLTTESVNVAVTVTSPAGTPTGSVAVSDGAGSMCSINLVAGAGSCSLIPDVTGMLTLTASYGGDVNSLPSSDTESHAVNSAQTLLDLQLLTEPPILPDEQVDFTFAVMPDTSRGAPDPTGTVTVTVVSGPSTGDSCSGSVEEGGCGLSFAVPGSYTVRADYSGDGNYEPTFSGELGVEVVSLLEVPLNETAWIVALLIAICGLLRIRSSA